MQASSVLIESIEELLQTAITRLTAEIKAETNPQRLETLLTLAFRARLPRIPATPQRTSPAPQRERMSSFETGEGRANGAKHQEPEANQPGLQDPSSSPASSPRTSSPPLTTEEELDAIQLPASSLPPLTFTPMSDEEFNKLERQIGYPEANRRRLIRAQLARDHPSPNANSA